MTKILSKKELAALKKQQQKIQTQIYNHESALEEKQNSSLIGKCFRLRNNYSVPQKPSDYWWLYLKVIGVDGRQVKSLQFQTDKYGTISIEKQERINGSIFAQSEEITRDQFDKAFDKLKQKVSKMNGN